MEETTHYVQPESADKDLKIAVSSNNHGPFRYFRRSLIGESAAMYHRLSSLRKARPVTYLGRPPQTGLSTVRVYPWIRAVQIALRLLGNFFIFDGHYAKTFLASGGV